MLPHWKVTSGNYIQRALGGNLAPEKPRSPGTSLHAPTSSVDTRSAAISNLLPSSKPSAGGGLSCAPHLAGSHTCAIVVKCVRDVATGTVIGSGEVSCDMSVANQRHSQDFPEIPEKDAFSGIVVLRDIVSHLRPPHAPPPCSSRV